MIKAIAIDDEPLALEVIEAHCSQLKTISLERSFTNLDNARRYINKFDIDVIFLDIEMPKTNGIDFYSNLNKVVKVIFTTAHSKYAVEGFRVNAIDYLLKPISLNHFKEATDRVSRAIALENKSTKENTHLAIRANYKLYNIDLKSILYIEAMDDYVKIHIENESSVVARSTMKGIIDKLPESQFVRVHKSYIVPINKIKTVQTQTLNLLDVEIPIGNAYKKNLEN